LSFFRPCLEVCRKLGNLPLYGPTTAITTGCGGGKCFHLRMKGVMFCKFARIKLICMVSEAGWSHVPRGWICFMGPPNVSLEVLRPVGHLGARTHWWGVCVPSLMPPWARPDQVMDLFSCHWIDASVGLYRLNLLLSEDAGAIWL